MMTECDLKRVAVVCGGVVAAVGAVFGYTAACYASVAMLPVLGVALAARRTAESEE